MYLVELNPDTGLVQIDGPFDGVMAIKEFRNVIINQELGIKCFTAIALTVDYLTPISHYRESDRPYKAMEEVCEGNRRAFDWNQDLIQEALIKYDNLQFNADIEEKRALDFLLLDKLQEINDAKEEQKSYRPVPEADRSNIEDYLNEFPEINKYMNSEVLYKDMTPNEVKNLLRKANDYVIYPMNQRRKKEKSEQDQERMTTLFKQLGVLKDLIKGWEKNNEGKDAFADGPVVNGYKLSRLEEKALNKNSFYHK